MRHMIFQEMVQINKVQPEAGKKVKVQLELKKVDPEKFVILHDKWK